MSLSALSRRLLWRRVLGVVLASSDGGASAFAAVDFSRCLAHLGLRVGNFFGRGLSVGF